MTIQQRLRVAWPLLGEKEDHHSHRRLLERALVLDSSLDTWTDQEEEAPTTTSQIGIGSRSFPTTREITDRPNGQRTKKGSTASRSRPRGSRRGTDRGLRRPIPSRRAKQAWPSGTAIFTVMIGRAMLSC
jgi:hypothetical protein